MTFVWRDAQYRAVSATLGRELWSADRDFSRFAEIAAINPLVAKPT